MTQWRADSLRFCHGYSPLKIAISQNTICSTYLQTFIIQGFREYCDLISKSFRSLSFYIYYIDIVALIQQKDVFLGNGK